MQKVLFIVVLFSLAVGYAAAQDAPFQIFIEAVKKEPGGFNGNKENLSTVFNAERIRLGGEFEVSLWKYVDSDEEKHYWIPYFLTVKSYLHDNSPLPELASRIRQKALDLLVDKKDKSSIGRRINLMRELAISFKQQGKQELAIKYKTDAEEILRNRTDLTAYLISFSGLKRCIYENLVSDISNCRDDPPPTERIVSGGVLNDKAIKLPQVTKYPDAAKKTKAEGIVRIKVLVDFDGNVIEAEPIGGRPELFEATLEAARRAKFGPMTLMGKPVKVSGVLVYNFVL